MRKLFSVALLSFTLSGCASMQQPPTSPADFIRTVQQATAAACSFVPIAATITGLINAGLTDVFTIVNNVCAAVSSLPVPVSAARRGAAPSVVPVVRGVPIRGSFVR